MEKLLKAKTVIGGSEESRGLKQRPSEAMAVVSRQEAKITD